MPHDLVDNVEGVAVALAVWVRVAHANDHDHVYGLPCVLRRHLSVRKFHGHIRLWRRFRVGFFVVTLTNGEALRDDFHRPLDAQGIGQGVVGKKLFQVLHNGVLQKLLCHAVAPP